MRARSAVRLALLLCETIINVNNTLMACIYSI